MAEEFKPNTSYGFSEQRLIVGAMLALLCGFVIYIVYEAVMVTAAEQLKRLIVVSPLLLVVIVHWLSCVPPSARFSIPVPGSDPGDIHRAGGSPWGVGLLLLLLFFLITYQPSFNLSFQ